MPGCTVKTGQILEGYIHNGPWEHCLCFIRAKIDEDTAKTIQGSDSLNVVDNTENALFCGKVVQVTKPVHVFGDIEVTITAYSSTIDMDMVSAVHTYQHKNLEEITGLICGENKADFIVYSREVKNAPENYYLQSGETDWEFLNNLMQQKRVAVWADCSSLTPRIYLSGLYDREKRKELKKELYFYNGCIYPDDRMMRGKEITRSGETETLHEAAWAVYRYGSNRVTAETADPAGWNAVFYQNPEGASFCGLPFVHGQERALGFSAKTWIRNDCILIAFEGTSMKDMGDIAYDLNAKEGIQLEQARYYVDKVLEAYPGRRLYVSGHSLGGHLAMEAALYLARTGRAELLQRVEAFNALGLKTFFGKKDEEMLKGKVFRRDYQFDVVSEELPRFGEGTVYPDEIYEKEVQKYRLKEDLQDFFANPMLESARTILGPAGLKAKAAARNHAISRFRHLYVSRPSPYRRAKGSFTGRQALVLDGKVIAVSNDRLKLSFETDRGATSEADAFNFIKSFSYSGMYMMPGVGDTVKVAFYKTAFNMEQVFELARCSSVNRRQ